jgi:hypothetical protein
MIERGQYAGLAVEPSSTVGVGQPHLGQDLDRHVASEPRVAGAIDLAHASGPEERDDFIRADVAACTHGHLNRMIDEDMPVEAVEASKRERGRRATYGNANATNSAACC